MTFRMKKISRDLEHLLKERMSNKGKIAACCLLLIILIILFSFGHLKVMPGTLAGSLIAVVTLLTPLLLGYIGLFVALVSSVLAAAGPLNIWVRHDDPFFITVLIFIATNFVASAIIAIVVEQNWKSQHLFKTLSITDGLTGLYNHRYFQQRLDQEISRSSRSGKPLTLCMIDIDHFKRYNDTYGHHIGDEVLKEAAQLIKSTIRRSDIICRYGGDEFSIIMPDIQAEEVRIAMERLRKAFRNHEFLFPNNSDECWTLSIGFSSFPDLSLSKEELITQADKALYQAKNKGRNRVECIAKA